MSGSEVGDKTERAFLPSFLPRVSFSSSDQAYTLMMMTETLAAALTPFDAVLNFIPSLADLLILSQAQVQNGWIYNSYDGKRIFITKSKNIKLFFLLKLILSLKIYKNC